MTHQKNKIITGALCVALATAAGCASPGKRTAIGAGAGAAGGSIVGAVAGGKKGALIGAAAGAGLGAVFGNYLDKRQKELDEVAETKKTADGLLVQLDNDLLFPTGSATLKGDAVDTLKRHAAILVKYPDDRLKVQGHTDNTGTVRFNMDLSKRRAASVRNVFLDNGVRRSQLTASGFGESRPVANNGSGAGREKNRRVEIKIDVPQEQAARVAEENERRINREENKN